MNQELPRSERLSELETRFLTNDEKQRYEDDAIDLLGEYPDNFFSGLFEEPAREFYRAHKVVMSFHEGKPAGCLFFNDETNECYFLAVTKRMSLDKSEVAKKLFQTIFDSKPKGTKVFWYINAEDAVFEGKAVGQYFERGRKLYKEMGATFTKVENKFGEGNHAYLVEITT